MEINTNPRVSIGLPVYNGENFLEEAVGSILNQTFHDFELIISDNGSTDKTQEISERYAALDPRIRYYRHSRNRGAAWNFNHVFHLSRGSYFKWAAHDDLITPGFLENAVKVLDDDPEVVLCSSLTMIRYGAGENEEPSPTPRLTKSDDPDPFVRFRDSIAVKHWCFDIFGLFRSNILKKTPLIKDYIGSDRVLLSIIAVTGKIHILDDFFYINRDHSDRSIKIASTSDLARWYNPRQTKKKYRLFKYYIKQYAASVRYPRRIHDKIKCSFYTIYLIITRSYDLYVELYVNNVLVRKVHSVYRFLKKSILFLVPLKKKGINYESISDR